MFNPREVKSKDGHGSNETQEVMEHVAAAPAQRMTRSQSERRVLGKLEPNNPTKRAAADKEAGLWDTQTARLPPSRRSIRLAKKQPACDDQNSEDFPEHEPSTTNIDDDSKPAAVVMRPSRGRPGKKEPSDALEPEQELDNAALMDGRMHSFERRTKNGAAAKRTSKGGKRNRKRARSEDLQHLPASSSSGDSFKKRRSASLDGPELFTSKLVLSVSESQQQKETEKDLPARPHCLAITAFDPAKFTAGISAYDSPHKGNVLLAPEYTSDIFQRLYIAEAHHSPQLYIGKKRDAELRSILIDWLVGVHMKFCLVPECLYLTVSIIDRFLAKVPIDKDTLQLVGITSLFVAAKYEEIYPPAAKDCVYVTDRAFTKQDILDMELEILDELKYSLTVPTLYPFLTRFLFLVGATETVTSAASYYAERTLVEHESLKYRPSEIAAAAVCLAISHPEIREADNLRENSEGIPKVLLDYTGFAPERIKDVAEFVAAKVSETLKFLHGGKNNSSLKIKYGNSRFKSVATNFQPPDAIDLVADP